MTTAGRANATLLYGAGRMGREAFVHGREQGIEPRAFVDRAARLCLCIDDLCAIEGAERFALDGATQTIRRQRPDHPRSHAHNGFDTVRHAEVTR